MIRSYTEQRFYAVVKIHAPKGTDSQVVRNVANDLDSKSDFGGDVFLEGLTITFESDHSCERRDAEIEQDRLEAYFKSRTPKGWELES